MTNETLPEEIGGAAMAPGAVEATPPDEADGRWDKTKAESIGQTAELYADISQRNYDRQMEQFGHPSGQETGAEYRDRVTKLLDEIYDSDPDLFSRLEPQVFLGIAGQLADRNRDIEASKRALEAAESEKNNLLQIARQRADGQATQAS